jgi:hypothetical protein
MTLIMPQIAATEINAAIFISYHHRKLYFEWSEYNDSDDYKRIGIKT